MCTISILDVSKEGVLHCCLHTQHGPCQGKGWSARRVLDDIANVRNFGFDIDHY